MKGGDKFSKSILPCPKCGTQTVHSGSKEEYHLYTNIVSYGIRYTCTECGTDNWLRKRLMRRSRLVPIQH